MAELIDLTDATFDGVVMKAGTTAVAVFYTPSDIPSGVLLSIVRELVPSYPDIVFGKLDCNSNTTTASTYGVLAVPLLMICKNGQQVRRILGARPKGDISQALDSL